MPTSIEETWKTLQARMPSVERPWRRSWGIILLDQGKVDGKVEEANVKDGKKGRFIGAIGHPFEAVIGYRLLPEYWGKGYMTEALRCFLGMWFELEGMLPPFFFAPVFFFLSHPSPPRFSSSPVLVAKKD